MGRLESLTALALGRGPYEDHVVDWAGDGNPPNNNNGQIYNEHGHPRNPETRRREREAVRSANEVMQVTGVVEDLKIAREKAFKFMDEKNHETYTGLRLMELGRASLVVGVWGVLGLRRRILLYKPYAELPLWQILQQDTAKYGLPHVIGSAGLGAVCAYHAADWAAFFFETILDTIWDEEGKTPLSPSELKWKERCQKIVDFGFSYITLHFRIFAILQQLNLIPSSQLLPSLKSFIPFLVGPPLLFPIPSLSGSTTWSALSTILRSATPLLFILLHGKAKLFATQILYRPIYKVLPRPSGDSMFAGLHISPPTLEYDTPDLPLPNRRPSYRAEDAPTLRALEGPPNPGLVETSSRPAERDSDSSADDGDIAQTTLISFDVTDSRDQEQSLDGGQGHWSAELRSANDEPLSNEPRYRVTGLTMLPTIMATEGLREIAAGILVMPIEALMVRSIGRLYRTRTGSGVGDMYPLASPIRLSDWTIGWTISPTRLTALRSICWSLVLQLAITGTVWAGFTVVSQWAARKPKPDTKRMESDMIERTATT